MVLFKRIILLLLVTCVIIGCKEESMQKLKYVNANGIELDLTSGHYGITKWSGFSNVGLNLQTQQVPYEDGSVFIDGLLNNRELSVTLAINDNNNLALRYELRSELISTLNPKLGEGYLYYKNDYLERRIKVIPQLPVIENKNTNESGSVKASLSWTACSVYWEDVEEISVNINMSEKINIENKGDVAISPKITFTGSALNPVLRNLNNKTKVSIKGLLTNSVLDLAKGKKTFLKTKYGFTNNNNYNNFEENDDFQLLFSPNCISKTEDFENFETIYIMPNENVICSGYGRGLFFYGGDNLKKSSDGEEWETIADKPSGTVGAIYYDKIDDVFYFGIGGHLYSTSDLATFTDVGSVGVAINAITRHGSLIICVGNGGICYKYDGTNFTEISTGTNYDLFAIASDGTNLVIGGGQSNVGGVFKYSVDNGSTWNNVSVTQRINSICYSNTYGLFFACGDIIVGKGLPGNMSWEELGAEARSVCKESKLFGQIELLGVDMVVYDGGEFKKLINYPYDTICGVYFKGKYIAAGAFGHIYTSDNFTWWEESPASGTISNNIKFAEIADDTAYFFTAEGDIISTTDGVNFNFKPVLPQAYRFIAYLNGYYYGVTETGIYKFSLDEIENPTLVHSNTSSDSCAIYVLNNNIIVCRDTCIQISSDGTTWTEKALGDTEQIDKVVYFDNKYICITHSNKYTLETTDFETYTPILVDYRSGYNLVSNIFVINNNFFFAVSDVTTYETTLYRGLSSPSAVKHYDIAGIIAICYYNDKYIINWTNYTTGYHADMTDFNGYSETFNNIFFVENNRLYSIDNEGEVVYYNGNIIIDSISNFTNCYYNIANGVLLDNNIIYELPSGNEISSSIKNTVTSVCSDNDTVYIAASNLYIIKNKAIEKNSSVGVAVACNGDSIYLISNSGIEKYLKSDLSTPIATYTVTPGTINQGACVYYNNYVIWATDTAIVTYNLNTGIKKEISTNVLVYDLQIIDGIVFGIGQGGITYMSDMQNVTELYKMSFVFGKFVRGDIKKFIALYGALGELIILNDENIISMITDISFELAEGENELVLSCDSGTISALLTYRQLYMGV